MSETKSTIASGVVAQRSRVMWPDASTQHHLLVEHITKVEVVDAIVHGGETAGAGGRQQENEQVGDEGGARSRKLAQCTVHQLLVPEAKDTHRPGALTFVHVGPEHWSRHLAA